jgi:hypothetical protein
MTTLALGFSTWLLRHFNVFYDKFYLGLLVVEFNIFNDDLCFGLLLFIYQA